MLSWMPARQREARAELLARSPLQLPGIHHMRLFRFLPLPVLFAAALLVAGCGGGSPRRVPNNAVAVVGGDTITKTQFDDLLSGAKRTYAARKTPFPKVGTAKDRSLQDDAVR